jgi:hypothetical protein
MNRKYLIVVALLAVLAVVFGVAGTIAPALEEASPQQSSSSPSSSSVAHFQNPPTYDSGWVNITDKQGQHFNVTHNLNSTDVIVDITGKTTPEGNTHKTNFGLAGFPGWEAYITWSGGMSGIVRVVAAKAEDGYAVIYEVTTQGRPMFYFAKTDSFGRVKWQKKEFASGYADMNWIVPTFDGGYAIAGMYQNITGEGWRPDFWLIKTDEWGNVTWSKTYGDPYVNEFANSLVATRDGGYALAGYTTPDDSAFARADLWLVKTDSSGNMQWNRTYGTAEDEVAYSLIEANGGGYAIAGYTNSSGESKDMYLVRTDQSGIAQWTFTYGFSGDDVAYSMIQSRDGDYLLVGGTEAYNCALVIWVDGNGHLRQVSVGGGGIGARVWGTAQSVIQADDGTFAIAGSSGSYESGYHMWLMTMDNSASVRWYKDLGPGYGVYSLFKCEGGAYLVVALSSSFDVARALVLVKTDVLESGLAQTDCSNNNITLYRGATDTYWNFVRVRVWAIKEPTWQYGDINQDGVVDARDLYILSQNYGKTFSAVSVGGIVAVASVHTYKKRKQKNS